jgi:hypothetical protein
MDEKRSTAAPVAVALLLALPLVVYVAAYAMMLTDIWTVRITRDGDYYSARNYRFADNYAAIFFWPVEQIDRRIRPDAHRP